jgi:hypothetical protein
MGNREAGEILADKDAMLIVAVAPDAQMSCPVGELQWQLRYGDADGVRYTAASVVDSFEYLINHCAKDEAWRRIKLMRVAMAQRK